MKRFALFLFVLTAALRISAFDSSRYSGNPLHWSFLTNDTAVATNVFNRNTHAIRYYLAADGYSGVNSTNTPGELNALRNCFGEWQSITNTLIRFEEAGLAPTNYDVNTADNSNVVYWARSTLINNGTVNMSGALGICLFTYSTPAGNLHQFDIALNAAESTWFTDFSDKNNTNYFVEGAPLHEIGHSLGLNHSVIGGATMLWAGDTGVDAQTGLSADEIAFAKARYGNTNLAATLGNLVGTVTTNGLPVLGAAVIIQGTNGLVAGGMATLTNGTYSLNGLPPGDYVVRVVPLDPDSASESLIRGVDAAVSGANTSFFSSGDTTVTLTAGTTNTLNIAVASGTPAFRITYIRAATSTPSSYSISGSPILLSPGQSNKTVGVFSSTLPTSGATVAVSGDGVSLGAPTYQPGNVFSGLNGISWVIGVSSNATPGLRTISITKGTNFAYAHGFLEILPKVYDYNYDGLDDVFQRKYFTPFTSTNAAPSADPDGDGFNNSQEYTAGTIPTNSLSLLKIDSITRTATNATVVFESVPGKSYTISASTNLASTSWTTISNLLATSSTSQVRDPITNTFRFYRVQVLP